MNAMWTENLAAYSIQVALLVAVGGGAAAALRLKQPRVLLAYWQALLAAAVLLPLLEPGREGGLDTLGQFAGHPRGEGRGCAFSATSFSAA